MDAGETTETLGVSAQVAVCLAFGLDPGDLVERTSRRYLEALTPIVRAAFAEIGSPATSFETFSGRQPGGARKGVVNFVLANGKTASIKTSRSYARTMACPPVVGQCGDAVFLEHFGDLFEGEVNGTIRKQVVESSCSELFPVKLDYLFFCDYSVWVFRGPDEAFGFRVIRRSDIEDQTWEQCRFTMTKTGAAWKESSTLKYDGESIAEVQVHRHRRPPYKFRFHLAKLLPLIEKRKRTTETLGMSAELATCREFGLEHPEHLEARSDPTLVRDLRPVVGHVFGEIGDPVEYVGTEAGARGGASKSPVDFYLQGRRSVSLKTNVGRSVCPPEVGQPATETFLRHFRHLINWEFDRFGPADFKRLCIERTAEMLGIYLDHLLDCDHIIWLRRQADGSFVHDIVHSDEHRDFVWEQERIELSQTLETWNECCSLKHDGISLGSFQAHSKRVSWKFRFNFPNLLQLIRGQS